MEFWKFFLITCFAFVSIFCWFIFISSNKFSPLHIRKLLVKNDHFSNYENFDNNKSIVIKQLNRPFNEQKKYKFTKSKKVRNIFCEINGEYKINCLKINSSNETSIYIPFSFIRKYFGINGKIVKFLNKNQEEYFEWSHSYSKIIFPDEPYSPNGKFLWFGNYNVELRDRVKCISTIDNVPISTQWYSKGHQYPTQIAQFGLSHFNKNLSEPTPKSLNLYDKISEHLDQKTSYEDFSFIVESTKNYSNYLIAETSLKISGNFSLRFIVFEMSTGNRYHLIYSTKTNKSIEIHKENKTVTYGLNFISIDRKSFLFVRDLFIDLFKSNLITTKKRNLFLVDQIIANGMFQVRSFNLKTSAHAQFAMAAANWLVKHQNKIGGWEIKVKRKLSNGALVINEGWHSAMGQGHSISLLTRIYLVTNNSQYLEAAKKALQVFEIESFKNGVKAMLFDKHVWYEEYPTVPSIFVLNGFIYSLFGLYDLSKVCDDQDCEKSRQLFEDGVHSLEIALPLFDSGSGSFYDLRHLSLGKAPNLARWDYHSTHINQLLFLHTIAANDLFKTTAERWITYMKGHRAPHN